jgi:ubiquitin C-terminal hydrolase
MSDKGLQLKFIIEYKTIIGQNIFISGKSKSLAEWVPNKLKLTTTNDPKHYPCFPKWESDFIKFDTNDPNLEYKYIFIDEKDKNKIDWESGENRKLNLTELGEGQYIIDDGNFNDKSKREIITFEEYLLKIPTEDYINHIEEKIEKINLENSDEIKMPETNKIGLQNIGSTCYMNATLQCFCHIRKFISYFKKINSNKLSQNSLSISFKNLIDHLWSEDLTPNKVENNYYIPTDFRTKIANKSPLFENNMANDAKDLVNFIIMTLHEELNNVKNGIINYNMQNGVMINQSNKKLVFKNFVEEFKKNNQSIISDIFYAMNLSETQCGLCSNILYNYQIYYFLVFPLEEVRKFKYPQFYQNNFAFNNFQSFNQINNYNNIPKEVSIYDCFDYEQKINFMNGPNQMYCNFCKINTDSKMMTHLVTAPEILILLLNRGKGLEFDVKINFVEYLNLEKYIEIKDTGFYYELIGVITHIGENGQNGHFIAYCRDPFTNAWSKFNDAIVTEVNNFKNDILDFANPYLLFYQKLK